MKDPGDVQDGPDLKDSTRVRNGANPNESAPPREMGPMPDQDDPQQSGPLRSGIGALLFLAWIIATIIWLASTVHESVVRGSVIPVVTAASAIALLVLLGAMEGLEVSVIDRWQAVWPGRPTSYLAGWLAARQLFVALIVTAATLLANRSILVIPGTSAEIRGDFILGVFDLVWVTLTVLWFAQILPKHMGATNPDRYLEFLRGPMFPVVSFVHTVGVSQPGEWTADFIEYRLDWPESLDKARSRLPVRSELAAIWCHLRLPRKWRAHGQAQSGPQDRPRDEGQDRPNAA